MFLPIIMIDRFGFWGLIVFAVPNVLGCAAFGYVLNRKSSAAMVERHGGAMRWFSIVAIAFHGFFAPYLAAAFVLPVPDLLSEAGRSWFGLIAAGVVLLVAFAAVAVPTKWWPLLACAVFGFSIVAFGQWGAGALAEVDLATTHQLDQLLWLAPALIVGFALCPYLDLTFHRALRESPSRHAFGVFGATFIVMLLFTVAYSGVYGQGAFFTPLVMYYILLQSAFTIAAHLRELRSSSPPGSMMMGAGVVVGALVACLAMLITRAENPFALGEDLYLRFLAFYGLVFPAYVIVFVGPWRRAALTMRTLALFTIVVLLALPFFDMAFLRANAWVLVFPYSAVVIWLVARAKTGATLKNV